MLVTPDLFKSAIEEIHASPQIALDTETTGLRHFAGDKLFSIAISTIDKDYYFDYNSFTLPTLTRTFHKIPEIIEGYEGVVHMFNAKFDMAMLFNEGVDTDKLKVNCTQQMERLLDSNTRFISLASSTKDLKESKDGDPIKEYMLKHNLWEWKQSAYRKKRKKNFFFFKVPLQIIRPYAEQDARSTLELGLHQFKKFQESKGTMSSLITTERRLTKVFQRMDRTGIQLDVEYTAEALQHEAAIVSKASEEFLALTGREFSDSGKLFKEVCDELGISYPLTEKGNPSFDKDALKSIDHPISEIITKHRLAAYRKGIYDALLEEAHEGILHANSHPAGPRTGRVSYSEPPMQCMEKYDPDDHEGEPDPDYLPRRCFTPRPGYFFAMLDFDQFEYRMMLNYAKEMDLINKVLGGLCVHTATGEMVGIARTPAKRVNFSLLYGSGDHALAAGLGIPVREGKILKAKYFRKLPMVQRLIGDIKSKAKRTGKLTNWYGRVYEIQRGFDYKGPNYLIQGGTADWVKIAMVNIDQYLEDKKSRMLLAVHDEIIFEIHEDEADVLPILKYIMENVSKEEPHTLLPYTVGVDYSKTNWQDKKPYAPKNS